MTPRNFTLRWLLMATAAASLAGCADLGYYAQSVRGHLAMLHAAQPVTHWLADPATPAALRARLELAQRARVFAVTQLHLPDNASYQRYADLHRNAAVWNVVAAPPLSLTLHPSCFLIVGCVGYRGYFDLEQARTEAARLAAQGLETAVYPVPAYSTLGWMNWAGGDPLLNTFVQYPEGDFVRLLFHELAHQVLYVRDDALFNESFATAVERLGGQLWLAQQASAATREAAAQAQAQRTAFRGLLRSTRATLAQIYAQASTDHPQAALARKAQAMQDFHDQYAQLRAQWLQALPPGQHVTTVARYDDWVDRANNAAFGALALYDDWVPAFEALFTQQGSDWPRFYAAAKALAALPKAERQTAMAALLHKQNDGEAMPLAAGTTAPPGAPSKLPPAESDRH